ncbi:MAG: hypothetical protein AB1445_02620 [Bacillota bacterium]
MDVGQRKGTPKDWENTLSRIRGVLSVRVTVKDDQVAEVHILARLGRNPKHVVRDAVSVLLTRHNVELDPRLVSIAQIKDGDELAASPARIRMGSLHYRSSGNWAEVDVSIDYAGHRFSGSSSGPTTSAHRLRLVAQATLNAVASCFQREDMILTLEDVLVVNLALEPTVMVAVGMACLDGEEMLTGSCLVRGEEWEAVARATLDAINRRFALVERDIKT